MGWLGWTEAQTLATSMPAIVLAREGRAEMIQDVLKAVYGPGPKDVGGKEVGAEVGAPPKPQISDDAIRAIFLHMGGPRPD